MLVMGCRLRSYCAALLLTGPSLCANHANATVQGGQPDWGTGMGTLSIYFDNMNSPVLSLPLNLAATLKLDQGRGFIGLR